MVTRQVAVTRRYAATHRNGAPIRQELAQLEAHRLSQTAKVCSTTITINISKTDRPQA